MIMIVDNLYIIFTHGRSSPDEELEDWGFDGPIIGPLSFVHTTYNTHIKLGEADGDWVADLQYVEDLAYYDGCYYGDWCVEVLTRNELEDVDMKPRVQRLVPSKCDPALKETHGGRPDFDNNEPVELP